MNYNNKFSLKGKKAIILGGAGLIGSQVTLAFAQLGADVLILDINKEKGNSYKNDLQNKGYSVDFNSLDLTDVNKLEKNFSEILTFFKKVDVFVNCSYPRPLLNEPKSFEKINYNYFRNLVDVHMNSFAWLAKMTADKMILQKSMGSIIQMGSIYGVVGQNLSIYEGTNMPENMPYSAVKGGITNLTRQMASYYGKYNIRVNTISPGGIFDNQNKVFVENYSKQVPLKRMGNPEEIAAAVIFLASDASSYVTGQNLIVDGGWTSI